ncbi:peptide ligase PGM1-related protein [Streptomyces sp. CA-181903]|uniref:preATP grasp domain-containing protein n=1 Tax=Streptomyces sp. CA-181903 TaxID=3240055 RepID=UPI003D913DDB
MPRIVLLNVGTAAPRAVHRQLWLLREGDVVVVPFVPDEDFLRYVCGELGADRAAIRFVSAGENLTDEALTAPALIREVRALLADHDAWELLPAHHTEGVAAFADLCGLPPDTGLRFAAQRGPVLLNRKSHFRQLAVGADVPVPEGTVVTGPAALAAAVERYLPRTGTVVVKRDDDLGGQGNVALTLKEARPLPGTRATLAAHAPEAAADVLWAELTDRQNPVLAVESYHRSTHSFYAEYVIGPAGEVTFLDSGTIRRRADTDPAAPELVWVGLELPAELPAGAGARALTASARMVALAAAIGYRGHINVDGIVTDTGEVLFNEANARWGGSLALHAAGERLLGPAYLDTHVLSGLRDVPALPLPVALDVLRRHGLAFSPETGEGTVVLGYDPSGERPLECVVLAPTRERARAVEVTVRDAVGEVRP